MSNKAVFANSQSNLKYEIDYLLKLLTYSIRTLMAGVINLDIF